MPSVKKQLFDLNKAFQAAMFEAVEECGQILTAEAKQLAPYKTGDLKESIVQKKTRKSKGKIVSRTDVGDRKYAKGISVEYGSIHGDAQPYMTPAAEGTEDKREAVLWKAAKSVLG